MVNSDSLKVGTELSGESTIAEGCFVCRFCFSTESLPSPQDSSAVDGVADLDARVINAPKRIYLVMGCDDAVGDVDFNECSRADICWCEDRIYDTDIEYVRADSLAATLAATLAAYIAAGERVGVLANSNYELKRENELLKQSNDALIQQAQNVLANFGPAVEAARADSHAQQWQPEQENTNSIHAGKASRLSQNRVVQDSSESAAQPPLEDPTQFTARSFAMIWNEGHSIRLINREGRGAISIPWDEISALRALLKGTYPVGGGEV